MIPPGKEVGYQSGGSASIASGGTTSGAIDLRGYNSGAIKLSAEFSGDTISFLGAAYDTDTYVAIHNSSGSAVSFTASSAKWHELPQAVFGCGFIKVVTSVATSDVAAIPFSLRVGGGGTPPTSISVTADTEMPAAAALADSTANPTTTLVGAMGHTFNGTTWDRVKGGTGVVGVGVQRVTLATDVALPAGENHLGQIALGGIVVSITPTVDTSAYTAGDVFFDSTAIANAVRVSGGKAKLTSVTLLDEDDQTAAAITLFFLRSNVSLGTANSAPSITDANAREIQGHVAFAAGDFVDVGGAKIGCLRNLGLILQPTTGTTLYVAATCAGTPTQTAGGIKVGLGFEYL